jgi:NAD+ diphosphatase
MNFNYCPNCGREKAVEKQNNSNYACQSCGWRFWNNPKTSVTTLFIKGDQVLTAIRGIEPFKGRAELIGGFVDYNESPYDAARREALEETGVKITEFALLDVWHREYDTSNMPPLSVVDCTFVVTKWEGTPEPHDDIASLEWRPIETVEDPNQAFHYPGLTKKLKAFLNDRRKP